MSLDLKLLPFDHDDGKFPFSHTVLRTYGGYELGEKLSKCNQLPVPERFSSYLSRNDDYEESHYGETIETPYGERLTYTTAEEILKAVPENHPAAWAYLKALPPQTKVALFWD